VPDLQSYEGDHLAACHRIAEAETLRKRAMASETWEVPA